MILFYSEHCPHCRMLLDTIQRHDTRGLIKLVSVEGLRAAGKNIPRQIHSVPALTLEQGKVILFGKQVFDYLLLPGSGKLLMNVGPTTTDSPNTVNTSPQEYIESEPMAYSMSSGMSLSDAFAPIDSSDIATADSKGLDDRSYSWTMINEPMNVSVNPEKPVAEETRTKKGLPDIDTIRAQRELDLKQNDISTTSLPPPSFTR